jgi:hypothetical protein
MGAFNVFDYGHTELMLRRNVLKLRKEERLIRECGEDFTMGTSGAHQQRLRHNLEVTDALQLGRKAHAKLDDWKAVCLFFIRRSPH